MTGSEGQGEGAQGDGKNRESDVVVDNPVTELLHTCTLYLILVGSTLQALCQKIDLCQERLSRTCTSVHTSAFIRRTKLVSSLHTKARPTVAVLPTENGAVW